MNIRPIRNATDYENAMARIEQLMDAELDTEEGFELDILVTLAEAFEVKNFPIGAPDPVEAILFSMEQHGISRKDLEQYLGSRSKVSEVLNRKRSLSITQIRNLHAGLNIPYESLLGDG